MSDILIISNNLKELRVDNNFDIDIIADFLHISSNTYRNYESGTSEIPVKHMEKLADFYGLDAYDFYDENLDVKNNPLTFAFRAENLQVQDLNEIANFKKIVKNYKKLNSLI